MPTGLLNGALLGLLAVVSALSLLIVGNRLVRRHRQRRRERIVAPVRGPLLQLLCAEEDEQTELLHRLAEIDRRTWIALEPTLTALLGKVAGGARTALVRLYELRGAAVDAVADLSSRSAARRGRAAQVLGQLRHRPAAPSLCRLLADHDPEVRLAAARAQLPAHIQARHARHPDVEQCQVDRVLTRGPERRHPVLHGRDLVTALGQFERHQIPDVRVVVGYQDMSHYSSCDSRDSWARERR
jgi:hypothetical protein